MRTIRLCVQTIMLLPIVVVLSCAMPIKSENQSIIIPLPVKEVYKITINVFIINYVKIEKEENNKENYYVEGFVGSAPSPWKTGFVVSVWLEPLGTNRTKVFVDAARRGHLGLLGTSPQNVADELTNTIKKSAEKNYQVFMEKHEEEQKGNTAPFHR